MRNVYLLMIVVASLSSCTRHDSVAPAAAGKSKRANLVAAAALFEVFAQPGFQGQSFSSDRLPSSPPFPVRSLKVHINALLQFREAYSSNSDAEGVLVIGGPFEMGTLSSTPRHICIPIPNNACRVVPGGDWDNRIRFIAAWNGSRPAGGNDSVYTVLGTMGGGTIPCFPPEPAITPATFPDGGPSDGDHRIQSVMTNGHDPICIEVRRDDQSDPGRFQQQDCRQNGQTKFTVRQDPDSHTYYIQAFTGRYMDEGAEGRKILGLGSTQIQTPDCRNYTAQARWVLRPAGSGIFQIVNQASGHCVHLDDISYQGAIYSEACTGATNEQWRFIDP